jgi:NADPH:quinone reductase-like Zn-dependent oxidoreductase
MKKVVVHAAGGYDRLAIETHAEPQPGPGEVAVDVDAIGVNFADCVVRMGLYPSAKEYVGWPITPGFEVAGRVAAVGAGVDDIAVGTEVITLVRFGAYATRVVAPRSQVFPKPDGMSASEAAALSVVHLTAYYALCELCRLRPGMHVLVHSAAGGVGGALLQIGKIHDCVMTGVVGRTDKIPTARALGADHVIDKSREPLWKLAEQIRPRGYEVILDANGVETLRQSYKHLAPTGRLVIYGFSTMLRRGGSGRPPWVKLARDLVRTPWFSPMDMTNANKSIMAFNLSYLFEENPLLQEAMSALLGWVRDGRLKPPPITELPFAEVAEAHRALESGTTVGKVVLRT